MTNIIVETDLGFYIFIGIFLLLALLGFWMCMYMKLEVMHNDFNNYVYYTYNHRDCFNHENWHPYCDQCACQEGGPIHTDEGDFYDVPDEA